MAREDEWLAGWDPTPGIVSVWAEPDGYAHVWRRVAGTLVREDSRFRPWLLVASPDELSRLPGVTMRELAGPGTLRFVIFADDLRPLQAAVRRLRDRGEEVVMLPPEEQYLVGTGRTYFRDLAFDDLRRLQLDLETTGLDAERDRIFLIAIRDPDGRTEILEATSRR